jgi:hypothetical protein
MTHRMAIVSLVLLAGCGGNAPLATTLSGPSPQPAPDVFSCLRNQLKTTGFSQTSYDPDDMRLTARKIDEDARRPDTQFRRVIDKIEMEVEAGTNGNVSEIVGEASTFAEYSTQRGPTEEQQKTSETARNALQALIDKCSNAPVDSTSSQG